MWAESEIVIVFLFNVSKISSLSFFGFLRDDSWKRLLIETIYIFYGSWVGGVVITHPLIAHTCLGDNPHSSGLSKG